jgi:uncharacterized membrane protein
MSKYSASSVPIVCALVVGLLLSSVPASAQCLSENECTDLRSQLREFHKVVRPIVQEMRQLRAAIKDLAEDSPERPALIDQFRAERRKLRHLRRDEIRPLVREYRQGCKRC